MSGNKRNDDARESMERINQARQQRSDAAWRPFEEKWAVLITASYTANREVWTTPLPREATSDAAAKAALGDLLREMARDAARVAHTADFETRRGFRVLRRVLDKAHVCVVFNNNPYAGMPTRRDEELEEFRDWLAEMGVDELGFAEHPDRGADEGYSYALLLWCTDGSESYVAEQYEAIRLRSRAEIPRPERAETPPASE